MRPLLPESPAFVCDPWWYTHQQQYSM